MRVAPEKINLNQEDTKRRELRLKRRRQWTAEHPEQVAEWRAKTYANYLVKHGFTVTEPQKTSGEVDE